MSYVRPTFEQMMYYVQKYKKPQGMRILYRDFNVPNEKKDSCKKAWDLVKEFYDASREQETEKSDGDSGQESGEALQEEQEPQEDEKIGASQVRVHERSRSSNPEEEKEETD